jgi:protein-disulfide isomerase
MFFRRKRSTGVEAFTKTVILELQEVSMTQLKSAPSERDHHRGSLKAAVILVEYGDFQCPYCGAAFPEIERVVQDLKDKICFVFRHFPLVNAHEHALLAAMAAEAADQQGRFWPMHRLLYKNQADLSEENILKFAKTLGLNIERFQKDLERDDLIEKIQHDLDTGNRSGVNGTPTLYLNGRLLQEAATYENIVSAIQDLLSNAHSSQPRSL